MPLIESDVLSRFPPTDLQVVAVHCFHDAQGAAGHVQRFGLTFPVALDFDSELFRRLRMIGHVFPLNVVIDRAGRVAYVGDVLDDAVTVVDSLIP